MLAAIPGVVSMGSSAVKAVESLLSNHKTTDNFKNNVWSKVPFELRRIAGGHGKWHDTLTGESGNDAWGDVRAVAVVAGAVDGYVDANGVLYDNITGTSLGHEDAWARWTAKYGSAGFAQAYQMDPTAFRIFGANPADDPTIGRASPRPVNGAVAYVKDQINDVKTAAQLAADNIAGVARGAATGAQTGFTAGANSAAYTQSITQSPLLWVGLGVLVLVVIVVASKKRG